MTVAPCVLRSTLGATGGARRGSGVGQVEAKAYGATPQWSPGRPKIRARRLLLQWVTSALALYIAAILVPGVKIEGLLGAFVAAALVVSLVAAAVTVVLEVLLGTNDDRAEAAFRVLAGWRRVLQGEAGT